MTPARKKSMNLVAVGAAVVFILVYTIPTIQHTAAVDACVEQGRGLANLGVGQPAEVGLRASEDRREAVVVRLAVRFERMMVALRTLQANAQESLRRRLG